MIFADDCLQFTLCVYLVQPARCCTLINDFDFSSGGCITLCLNLAAKRINSKHTYVQLLGAAMAVKKQHCSASGGSAFRPRFAPNSTRHSAPVSR